MADAVVAHFPCATEIAAVSPPILARHTPRKRRIRRFHSGGAAARAGSPACAGDRGAKGGEDQPNFGITSRANKRIECSASVKFMSPNTIWQRT